jgi:hypothetical protein
VMGRHPEGERREPRRSHGEEHAKRASRTIGRAAIETRSFGALLRMRSSFGTGASDRQGPRALASNSAPATCGRCCARRQNLRHNSLRFTPWRQRQLRKFLALINHRELPPWHRNDPLAKPLPKVRQVSSMSPNGPPNLSSMSPVHTRRARRGYETRRTPPLPGAMRHCKGYRHRRVSPSRRRAGL